MQVSKWGNSLAIRLPKAIVELLGLKEGDEVEITVRDDRTLGIERDEKRKRALQRLKELGGPLPEGFKFDREEANER